MTNTTFFQQRLAEDENALLNLEEQRDAIDRQIEALREIVHIERAVVYREEPESDTPRTPGMPRWGSQRSRIHNAIEKMLVEHGTLHRTEIHERLQRLGLIESGERSLAYVSTIFRHRKDSLCQTVRAIGR